MIDNLELIKPLLNFVEKGDFYMLYILKRKKDQPESERDNHQSVRNIKTYCVDSLDYLDKRWEEIKMLCEVFKARAYIHIQKQNHFDVSLEMMVELAQRIKNDVNNQKGLFDSVVGKIKTLEKRWIVDIDSKDEDYINSILKLINSLNPIENKLISKIPTKSGFHLITRKFDLSEFSKKYPEIDVQKKNPTLLFLPNSLI
jgi:hypothetical protein